MLSPGLISERVSVSSSILRSIKNIEIKVGHVGAIFPPFLRMEIIPVLLCMHAAVVSLITQ